MKSLTVFPTLTQALRAGYHVYDRTGTGYIVRNRTADGWMLALVDCHNHK